MKRRLRWALAIAIVALAAVAAGVTATAYGSSKTPGIIIDGTTGTVVNIDPANEYDYDSFSVDLNIFQGLYGFPTNATLQPVLATGCTSSTNLRTWTCSLRHGVHFSNGDPMTSTDVKYSFDRVQAIKGDQGIYTLLSYLKSTSTSGPYKVVFHLTNPDSVWPQILATNAGYVVDHKTFPKNSTLANTDTAHMIGTGPYKLTKFTPGTQAVFGLNPHYWGTKPANGGLIIDYYSSSSTMKLDLQNKVLDMAFQTFDPTQIAAMKKDSSLTVHSGNGVVIRYLVFNVKRAPFNNINVRKAIAYLMPRQTIAKDYNNTVSPLYSMVPKGLPGQTDAFKAMYGASPNLTKAKAAMKAAHVKKPLPITLWYTPTHYGSFSVNEYGDIQRALDNSGLFKVTLKTAEWADYATKLGKVFGGFQLGWFPDYPDADDYTVSFYQTGSFFSNGYSSAKMDGLIKKERASTGTARYNYLKQIQMLGAQDVPTIPYWQGNMIAVSQKTVKGISSTLDAAFYMRFWKISK